MARIVIEEVTLCEHGRDGQCLSGGWVSQGRSEYTLNCPGGSRRLLDPGSYVLIEKRGNAWPEWARQPLFRYAREELHYTDEVFDALAGGEQP